MRNILVDSPANVSSAIYYNEKFGAVPVFRKHALANSGFTLLNFDI